MILEDLYRVSEKDEDTWEVLTKKGDCLYLGQIWKTPVSLLTRNVYSLYAVDSVITIYLL